MRLARLGLVRYGHFTDRQLELPARAVDLHLIAGDNEAGKSTTQAAIGDFLFGFGHKTPYAFAHETASLLVDAQLEDEVTTRSLRRRKGRANTLLDADGATVPEERLRGLLGGLDREAFLRMFSLDHERLREGGKQILEAQDLGQTLFEASAGLHGLRAVKRALQEEADAIYADRKAQHRSFYDALGRFEAAAARLRETTVLATRWREQEATVQRLRGEVDRFAGELAGGRAKQRRLERIRRVLPRLDEIALREAELGALGALPRLPPQAAATAATATATLSSEQPRLVDLAEQEARLAREAEESPLDPALLAEEAAIGELAVRRAEVEKTQADLPRRHLDREALLRQIAEISTRIERPAVPLPELSATLPTRPAIERVRALLEERSGVVEASESAQRELAREQERLRDLERQRDGQGGLVDRKRLKGALAEARELVVPAARRRDDAQQQQRRREERRAALDVLAPFSGSAAALRGLAVPAEARLRGFERQFEELGAAQRDLDAAAAKLDRELEKQRFHCQQLRRDTGLVTEEAVKEARRQRDGLWQRLRGPSAPDEAPATRWRDLADLVEDYELAVATADRLADDRFARVQGAAALLQAEQRLEQQEEEHKQLGRRGIDLATREVALAAEWAALCAPCGFVFESPARALEWSRQRREALHIDDDVRALEAGESARGAVEGEARQRLLDALAEAGEAVESVLSEPFSIVYRRAEACAEELEQRTVERKALQKQLVEAQRRAEQAGVNFEQSQLRRRRWDEDWSEALIGLGRRSVEEPAQVRRLLEELEALRERAERASDLVERIDKMTSDVQRFERDARRLQPLLRLAPAASAAELARQLVHDLGEQVRRRARHQQIALEREAARLKRDRLQQRLDEARAVLADLRAAAGAADDHDLARILERSQRAEQLRARIDEECARLREASDGLAREALVEECAGADRDRLPGQIDAVAAESARLVEEQKQRAVELVREEGLLAAIAGRGEAADAAEERLRALADLQQEAHRFARLRGAALLLDRAIERFRKERQAPLLRRAGALFATLTSERFVALDVELDDKDAPHLIALRGSGAPVPVDGLSDGTVDQLWLALRLAGVEEYLDRKPAVPFIADDLFINYDDARAAAGFRILAALARRTQVLFFTHHKHLIEVARGVLGEDGFGLQLL